MLYFYFFSRLTVFLHIILPFKFLYEFSVPTPHLFFFFFLDLCRSWIAGHWTWYCILYMMRDLFPVSRLSFNLILFAPYLLLPGRSFKKKYYIFCTFSFTPSKFRILFVKSFFPIPRLSNLIQNLEFHVYIKRWFSLV